MSQVPPLPALFLRNNRDFRLPPKLPDAKKQMLQMYFVNIGRVTNLDILLSILPNLDYYEASRELFYSLMNENNGPLRMDIRYYLAIMAASRYDCDHLIQLLEVQFQHNGGDISWLKSGLTAANSKLAKIAKLNALLAHQPWKITYKTIAVMSLIYVCVVFVGLFASFFCIYYPHTCTFYACA